MALVRPCEPSRCVFTQKRLPGRVLLVKSHQGPSRGFYGGVLRKELQRGEAGGINAPDATKPPNDGKRDAFKRALGRETGERRAGKQNRSTCSGPIAQF